MKKYIETRHVLDITDLPEPIKRKAYDYFADSCNSNGSYCGFDISDDHGFPELEALIKEHHPDITSFDVHYWW